jgi:hypothetical protein
MATYKVIQDIEAEDKLVGPLSLRQFIYAGISAVLLWLSFIVITKGVGLVAVAFVPPALLFGFLAFPWKGEQPTEVWALAKIQFLLKPRRRIWNQSGVKELVTITAPKRIQRVLTNGLSQTEVHSRLRALADTLDSRGWVVKNVTPSVYSQPGFLNNNAMEPGSDRLVEVANVAQPATYTPQASDDMLDMQHNPVAQKFDTMIAASQKAHRQEIMERMKTVTPTATAQQMAQPQAAPAPTPQPSSNSAAPANDYWFLNQPQQLGASIPQDVVTFNTQVVEPGAAPADLPVGAAVPTADEEEFIKHLGNQPVLSPNMGHLHVIQPLSAQAHGPVTGQGVPGPQTPAATQQPGPAAQPEQQMTAAPDAAILDLARNDDLDVATIAREAHKRKDLSDEVVISLH